MEEFKTLLLAEGNSLNLPLSKKFKV